MAKMNRCPVCGLRRMLAVLPDTGATWVHMKGDRARHDRVVARQERDAADRAAIAARKEKAQ